MRFSEIESFAKEMLSEYGLDHVEFKWSNAQSFVGQARTSREFGRVVGKQLKLSKPMLAALKPEHQESEILDVILHEIAHILANERYQDFCKHDYRWRHMAKKIGANPTTCVTEGTIDHKRIVTKYTAKCGRGCEYNFNRMGRHWKNGSYRCRDHARKLDIYINK